MRNFFRQLVRREAPYLVRALRSLADAVAALIPGPPAIAFPVTFHLKGATAMGEVTVTDTEASLTASVTFQDAEGNTTTPDDVPQWSSSDSSVATASASEDGLSATFEIGSPGATVIEVRSTNTDGSEVVSQGTITVQPGDAVIGSVEFTTGADVSAGQLPAEPILEQPALPDDSAMTDESATGETV